MTKDGTQSSKLLRRVLQLCFGAALYPAAYYAARFGPMYLKETIRPPVGLTTRFYTVLVFVPVVFLFLGLLKGRRLLVIHAAWLIAFALWITCTYQERVMNLARQLMWEDVPGKLPYLYAAGAVSYICVFIWDMKYKPATQSQDDLR